MAWQDACTSAISKGVEVEVDVDVNSKDDILLYCCSFGGNCWYNSLQVDLSYKSISNAQEYADSDSDADITDSPAL